jgi:hypothetical protein
VGFIFKGYLHIFQQDREYFESQMRGNIKAVKLTSQGVSPKISFSLTIIFY